MSALGPIWTSGLCYASLFMHSCEYWISYVRYAWGCTTNVRSQKNRNSGMSDIHHHSNLVPEHPKSTPAVIVVDCQTNFNSLHSTWETLIIAAGNNHSYSVTLSAMIWSKSEVSSPSFGEYVVYIYRLGSYHGHLIIYSRSEGKRVSYVLLRDRKPLSRHGRWSNI